MKEHALEAIPSASDIVLHAITDAGNRRSGELPDLSCVAQYRDYVNKDGATEADVRATLAELQRDGLLHVDGTSWKLLRDFP